ncbi:tetratricopeptide repeat protein [Chryseobacterium koreense]
MKKKQTEVMDFPRAEREQKCREGIEKYKDSGDLLFLAFCHHELGQILFQNQDYAQAFDHDLSALEIYKKIGYRNVPNIGKILHEIALHHYFFQDDEEVIKLMRISLRFPPFSESLDIQRYNNLGMSYMNLKMNDKARYFLNRAIIAANQYQNEVWKGILYGNMGNLYFKEEKYSAALAYYRRNFELNKNESRHSTVKINSHSNMAKVHLALGNITEADLFLKRVENSLNILQNDPSYNSAKHLGDRQQIEKTKKLYFETKINYLKKTGGFNEAVKYQDSLLTIRKDLDAKYNAAVAKRASDRLTIRNKELQLAQKEQEKVKQRRIYSALILLVLAMGAMGYFSLYRSRQKKKRQNARLIAETRISLMEKQRVQQQLEHTQKEISHFVSRINEQNQKVSNFETKLEKLKNLKNDGQSDIHEKMYKMKEVKILTDEDWIGFQNDFDAVFPHFRDILKRNCPDITGSEMRYLMLIKLKFSHKEMARALGVSDNTIRVTWSRVRKRLNGTLEDTPEDLIKKVITGENAMEAG